MEALSNRALAALDHWWVFNEPPNQRPLKNPAGGLRVAYRVTEACRVSSTARIGSD